MQKDYLQIKNLNIRYYSNNETVNAVNGIDLELKDGETLGLVGETGAGKTTTALSIMGLLPPKVSEIVSGSIVLDGEELVKSPEKKMRLIRGRKVAMIFQDPMTSLNPLFTVGEQIRGPLMRHQKLSRKEAEKKALVMLEAVGLPSPERRLKQYPHELSGGMRQRVMIAIAMCCKPELLIADEPTTALDVTIQAQILELMAHMKNEFNTSVILITHDLGVISSLCTRVIVMYGGLIMEEGKIEDIFYRTGHPYTAGLLASIPKRTKEKLVPIFGTPPDLLNPPKGCPFAARCSRAMKLCAVHQPPFCDLGNGHVSACWLHNESVKGRMGEVKL